MNTNKLLAAAVSLCMALWLCPAGSGAGQPAGSQIRGTPIRGEPIGGVAPASSVPATNSLGPRAVSVTNNPVSTGKAASALQDGTFVVTGFDKLSGFNFEGSDAPVSPDYAAAASHKTMSQIPASVKALNEKRVAVRGFMLPMKVDGGMVTEFLLLRNQMGCCYGMTPGINEWIDVRTSGKGIKSLMDDLITVYGTLHVGEVRENGYLTGIYRMDCERINQAN